MSSGETRQAGLIVGIDLGTTNSAMAWAEVRAGAEPAVFPVPQLVGEGELGQRTALPSVVYLAGDHDLSKGTLALPWRSDERYVVGAYARRLGARIEGRLIASAKSWLCHCGVDRTAAILPWGAGTGVPKLSPVEVSARILAHLREAWDAAHPEAPLRNQDVVLTVPASFDEVARELTVRAASAIGLERLRLLEEPQAAIYAWIAANPRWREDLANVQVVLVIDVGGGTTDFSLISVRRDADGLSLERIAVGEHLLLGGDNMDIALARRVVERRPTASGLDAARWQQLVDQCREAKEALLGEAAVEAATVSIAGRGRGVVQGAISDRLDREETLAIVRDGFFPVVDRADRPGATTDAGLVEFGLPFASDPAITRHLAAFLAHAQTLVRAGEATAPEPEVHPNAVLFNGGALKARAVRERLLDVLEAWSGSRPAELAGSDLDLAVARGAAAYGLALRGLGLRIGGGAARGYYVGLGDTAQERSSSRDGLEAAQRKRSVRLLCMAPRGMEEGETVEITTPEFEVLANAPVRFPIYASTARSGERGGEVSSADPDGLIELPPLTSVLRFGRGTTPRSVRVHLRSQLTETGTLELWCLARETNHRWRLSFDLRGASATAARQAEAEGVALEPEETSVSPGTSTPSRAELEIDADRLAAAVALLEGCFAGSGEAVSLSRALEEALGAGKDAWPLASIRALWDALMPLEPKRGRTPPHEARWLNLAGFLLRPGFGAARDGWRSEQIWRLYDQGIRSPGAAQVRAEWWALWKRIAGGLTRQQQMVIYQEIRALLLPEVRKKAKPGRWKAGPQELREMWQVAGSLERIPSASKLEALRSLAPQIIAGRASEAEIWAFGRLGARALVNGPANAVVEPGALLTWLRDLVQAEWPRPGPTALALAQMSRLTGDRARDLPVELREAVAQRLDRESEGETLARWVREHVSLDARSQEMVLAESLPVGLRIVEDESERIASSS